MTGPGSAVRTPGSDGWIKLVRVTTYPLSPEKDDTTRRSEFRGRPRRAFLLPDCPWPVAVVNPVQIRAFAKTDPIDAGVIAHFAEATDLEPRPLPDEQPGSWPISPSEGVRSFAMIGAQCQREQRLTAPRFRKSIARLIKALETELASRMRISTTQS